MRATIKNRTKAEIAALVAKMNAGRKRNEATKAGRQRRSELDRKAGLAAGVARRKRAAVKKAAEEVSPSRAAGAG
ncbi:MAG TPA: hypothetical protein VND64_01530 [Pirellulales bacterium]|nr:hypothetical protein [Pirellulales bacterium]